MLPLPEGVEPVSLGEGGTPLLRASRFGGDVDLWIKDESLNPTQSFKARGMAVAVSMAKDLGAAKLAAPSAGNAGGALAAYAARAGIEAHIFMPRDTPRANIIECRELGAHVTLIDGLITDCGAEIARRKADQGWFDMSTLKEPYLIEVKKTLGYELAEQLEKLIPVAGPIVRTKTNSPHVVALIGPTGVGKTTTIAKLAANLKLREKRRVGLITLDTYRIAATEQLKRYADIIGAPLRIVSNVEDLRGAVNTRILQDGCIPTHTICAPGDQAVDPHQEGHGPIRAHVPIVMDIFPRSEKTGYFGVSKRTEQTYDPGQQPCDQHPAGRMQLGSHYRHFLINT